MDKVVADGLEAGNWPSSSSLLTDRVEQRLRGRIKNLNPGAMLPSQEILVQELGASRHTIREAIERLKKDRLIQSTRGKGTFVSERSSKLRDVMISGSNLYHPYQQMCVGVLSSLLAGKGYHANVVVQSDSQKWWETVLGDHSRLRGLVIVNSLPRRQLKEIVSQSPVPVVTTADLPRPARRSAVCDTVLPCNEALGYHATDYLIRQGHRRIALVGWDFSERNGRDQLRGYREALREHHIESTPEFTAELPYLSFGAQCSAETYHPQLDKVQAQIGDWFAGDDPPTALVHSSASEIQLRDILEYYFLNRIELAATVGILYKEQLSHGYTGMSELTVVCVSYESIAARALELLLNDRNRDDPPVREIQERVLLYRRKNGQWEQYPANEE